MSCLSSTQEEADGGLLLHENHASEEGFENVIIASDDTDVFVLSLFFSRTIQASLYVKCGTKTRTKLVDIGKIYCVLGAEVVEGLVGMHAFTGCDSVSAFAGKGKLKGFQLLKADEESRKAFAVLGEEWSVSIELNVALESVVCKIYSNKPSTFDVNQLRYMLFCARKGETISSVATM